MLHNVTHSQGYLMAHVVQGDPFHTKDTNTHSDIEINAKLKTSGL